MDLARTVARELARLERDEVCCGDTTFQQFATLRTMHEAAAPMTTSALATALGIDLSTASRNLAVLERNGYIRRARAKLCFEIDADQHPRSANPAGSG